jgi:hypothetical protein
MVYARKGQKLFNKAKRYAKKRYTAKGAGYGTGLRLGKLRSDIALIKRSLNTEKKYITSGSVPTVGVGQCNVNASGKFYQDITPRPVVGTSFDQRIGKSIKVVAMALEYQLVQQTNCVGPRKFTLYIGQTLGTPTGAVTSELMDVNPITGVVDYMSNRDINYFKKYRILQKKNIYLKDDNISGQAQITTGKCIMKMNHHVQYDDNTTTLTDGQLWWFIVGDSGNAGTSNSSLTNVAVTGALTGASFQSYARFWYVDN